MRPLFGPLVALVGIGIALSPLDAPTAAPCRAASRSGSRPPSTIVDPTPDMPGTAPAIEMPQHLRGFGPALDRARAGHGIVRVTHLGDSSIGMDGLPHELRSRYQRVYGDAGPGFVLLQPHSASYLNRAATVRAEPAWSLCFIIRRCLRDGRYGLGGVSVESPRGAQTVIRPRDGRAVQRAELWYLAQPGGGELGFTFGPGGQERIATAADGLEDRWRTLERAAGDHTATVRALGGGRARAFGVVLENDGPGVVWDTLSMIGAFTPRLLAHDEAHFRSQLSHRGSDLVILSYGGNDLRRLVGRGLTEATLGDETHRVLARVRSALPDAGCLVIGINDHARSGNAVIEPAHVGAVEAAQRGAAARAGCAYWSTLSAMGGPATFERWRQRGLASDDGKHLSPRGRAVIGGRLFAALEDAHAGGTR
ncbi:MAG: GDSL-type esterase/lipase family protein [Sandaracinaceae bacterium]